MSVNEKIVTMKQYNSDSGTVDDIYPQTKVAAISDHKGTPLKDLMGKKLTMAEYKALSIEEQNMGLYYITDGNGSGSSGNSVELILKANNPYLGSEGSTYAPYEYNSEDNNTNYYTMKYDNGIMIQAIEQVVGVNMVNSMQMIPFPISFIDTSYIAHVEGIEGISYNMQKFLAFDEGTTEWDLTRASLSTFLDSNTYYTYYTLKRKYETGVLVYNSQVDNYSELPKTVRVIAIGRWK